MHPMKKVADDIENALARVGRRMSSSLKGRSKAQRDEIERIVRETRMRDQALRRQLGGGNNTNPNRARPDQTGFGQTNSRYTTEFFNRNPNSNARFVHHAVEQQVLTRYCPPLQLTRQQLNSISNLRGIPDDVNGDVHLSGIRRLWNQFYDHHGPGNPPTEQDLIDYANLVDDAFGDFFDPPVR